MKQAPNELRPEGEDFFCDALGALRREEVPFLVGGAYALNRYTGISRHTHDIDVFVRKADSRRALDALEAAGYRTELTHPHWLGKALREPDELDVIWSSGNGIAAVDDLWFEHGVEDEVLGVPVRLVPPEELIWSKAFVMERERFDGADIAHILRASAERLDWQRLVRRFEPYWRVLLTHLILFGLAYPGERDRIPADVVRGLLDRLDDELEEPARGPHVCGGTLLSREQYLFDIERWGYVDARLLPPASMSPDDIARWTRAIRER